MDHKLKKLPASEWPRCKLVSLLLQIPCFNIIAVIPSSLPKTPLWYMVANTPLLVECWYPIVRLQFWSLELHSDKVWLCCKATVLIHTFIGA